MNPKVEARIVQELGLKKAESVLLIGAASGYLAALLAHMTRHVTVLETSPVLKELAEKICMLMVCAMLRYCKLMVFLVSILVAMT